MRSIMLFNILCRGLDRVLEDDGLSAVSGMRIFSWRCVAIIVAWRVSICLCGFPVGAVPFVRLLVVVVPAEQIHLLISVLVSHGSLSTHSERAPRQRLRLIFLWRAYGGHVG